jgi:hypothetical protein
MLNARLKAAGLQVRAPLSIVRDRSPKNSHPFTLDPEEKKQAYE